MSSFPAKDHFLLVGIGTRDAHSPERARSTVPACEVLPIENLTPAAGTRMEDRDKSGYRVDRTQCPAQCAGMAGAIEDHRWHAASLMYLNGFDVYQSSW